MSPTPMETEMQGFNGLTVAAFESRMAKEMEDLITRHSGIPKVAPSMREIPLSENKPAFHFFENLQQGNVDLVIFMTGVGTRALFQALEAHYAPSRIQKAFKHASLVARGPKSVKALTEKNMRGSVVVPEPNTWREVLDQLLEGQRPVKGLKVAVQEYGVSNPEFLQALLEAGAKEVTSVPVYRWALPEDTRPLTELIESILDGEVPIALFTSAQQIRNVFEVADGLKKNLELREALSRMVIGSIGSVCERRLLRSSGLKPRTWKPEHPKMGFLVKEVAEKSFGLCQKKAAEAVRVKLPAKPLKTPLPSLKTAFS